MECYININKMRIIPVICIRSYVIIVTTQTRLYILVYEYCTLIRMMFSGSCGAPATPMQSRGLDKTKRKRERKKVVGAASDEDNARLL